MERAVAVREAARPERARDRSRTGQIRPEDDAAGFGLGVGLLAAGGGEPDDVAVVVGGGAAARAAAAAAAAA